jgi:hypothetical protein
MLDSYALKLASRATWFLPYLRANARYQHRTARVLPGRTARQRVEFHTAASRPSLPVNALAKAGIDLGENGSVIPKAKVR